MLVRGDALGSVMEALEACSSALFFPLGDERRVP